MVFHISMTDWEGKYAIRLLSKIEFGKKKKRKQLPIPFRPWVIRQNKFLETTFQA